MDIRELMHLSRRKKAVDEFIGIVYKKNGRIGFRYRRDFHSLFVPAERYREFTKGRDYDGVIVWIIESPHKWEFQIDIPLFPEGRQYARPLNNPSTQKFVKPVFEDHLSPLLAPSIGEGEVYLVLLVNSVEYQCSLGEKTSIHRDKNFISNWIHEGRDDFISRVKSYEGALFINSCTKGNINRNFLRKNHNLIERRGGRFAFKEIHGELGLHGMVEAELQREGIIGESSYIRYPHPSYFVYQEAKGGRVFFPEAEGIFPSPILTFDRVRDSLQLTIT